MCGRLRVGKPCLGAGDGAADRALVDASFLGGFGGEADILAGRTASSGTSCPTAPCLPQFFAQGEMVMRIEAEGADLFMLRDGKMVKKQAFRKARPARKV
jgi:hypothetical protein